MIKNIKKNLNNLNKSNQVCPVWNDQLKKRKNVRRNDLYQIKICISLFDI